MPSVLFTRPARRVKRNERQILLIFETHEITRLFQALHDAKCRRLRQLDAIGNLLQHQAISLRSEAFEYREYSLNRAHHNHALPGIEPIACAS